MLNKRQISILNLNMPKSKWNDAEGRTIHNFYQICNILFYINTCMLMSKLKLKHPSDDRIWYLTYTETS